MPHRCAHQFGLDQDIPFRISPPSTISAGSEGLARCWSSFLRIGTGSRFLMPKTARAATFTAFYCRWFHDLVHKCKSYPPPALVTLTCPARKDPERGVLLLVGELPTFRVLIAYFHLFTPRRRPLLDQVRLCSIPYLILRGRLYALVLTHT